MSTRRTIPTKIECTIDSFVIKIYHELLGNFTENPDSYDSIGIQRLFMRLYQEIHYEYPDVVYLDPNYATYFIDELITDLSIALNHYDVNVDVVNEIIQLLENERTDIHNTVHLVNLDVLADRVI